ncbi:MAG: hypothetical protein U0N04_00775 [Oscillospiraceae bacterium]
MKRRLFALALALLLAVSLPVSALARDWYIDDGDITISATENGQTVSQGNTSEADDAPVIKQRDSETATGSTITIKSTGDATANVTIKDVNISSKGDAIDVDGKSSAKITLEGKNKIFSETGSALHVSSGDVTIDGDGTLEAGSENEDNNHAAIGSHAEEGMSGDITIGGSAKVTAVSRDDGAGIGSGDMGKMSGDITIGDNAQVTAWSGTGGAGIGSGRENDVSGTITIGGNAQVTAGSNSETAGIGSGNNGSITSAGRIIIRDSAKVTAIGEDEGAGIGTGEDELMAGMIIIQDNAQVTAIAGDRAAAIGSDNRNEMTGTIFIIGNARVTTGILDNDAVDFDYNTKEIIYTLDENAIGYIGDSKYSNHESDYGHYVIGPDVTINGISGSDIEKLKQYVNMRLNSNGEPENLTKLEIRSENGEFTVTADGEGTVEKILYDGSETVPTAPGTYPVTCVVRFGDETLEFQIGTLIVPEPPAEAAQPAPVYHVTDKDGNQIPYTAAREGGVLTIRVDAAYARLTLTAAEAQALTVQGVEKVIFVTTSATSAFRPADLTAYKDEAPFVLTHDGETVTFTAGETDLASLLLQA